MSRLGLFVSLAVAVAACGSTALSFGTTPSDAGTAGPNDASLPIPDTQPDAEPAVADATLDAPDTFDPIAVPGLVLWLDASEGVTETAGAVSAWADRTTSHNDAAQTAPLRMPTFQASSINAHPALHFDKVHDAVNKGGDVLVISDASSLQWGTGDFYVVVIARFDNVTATDGPGVFFDKSLGGTPNGQAVALLGGVPTQFNGGVAAEGIVFNTRVQAGDFVTRIHPYNDNTPHAFAMQRSAAQLDLRVDGLSVGTSASAGVDVSNIGGGLGGGSVLIGGDYDATGLRLNGDIAEVLAVKGPLATSERAALEGYLARKYGL